MKIIIVITITLFVNHPPMPPSPVMFAMRLSIAETDFHPQTHAIRHENAA